MTFVRRAMEVTFSLQAAGGTGASRTFDGTNSNTVTLSGLRMIAKIQHVSSLVSDSTLDLAIYGMTKSQMNQLSTLGVQIQAVTAASAVVLNAGDLGSPLSTVFKGFIANSYADFQSAPDVPLRLVGKCGLPQLVLPTPASSFKGNVDIVQVMQGFASVAGVTFENNGVTGKLNNSYFYGPVYQQIQAAAREANINAKIINGVLAIWPRNGSRDGQVPIVSPKTGMIGYPTYTNYGIIFRSIYNPDIQLSKKIIVESDLIPPGGDWTVYDLEYSLETEVPKGKWEMLVAATNPKSPTPLAR